MLTIQTATITVVVKPVVGYSSAGYPIHHSFGKRLVSVVTLYIGKGSYYRVEYVLFVLSLDLLVKREELHYSRLAIRPVAGHSRCRYGRLAFAFGFG